VRSSSSSFSRSSPLCSRAQSTSRGSSAPIGAACSPAPSGRSSLPCLTRSALVSARGSPFRSGCAVSGCLHSRSGGGAWPSWALSPCCRLHSANSIYCKKCQ
jgi:hypothetical protein